MAIRPTRVFLSVSLLKRQLTSSAPSGGPLIRLNKLMRDRNLCSRKEADDLITRNAVTVDGNAALLGMMVPLHARVEIHAERPTLTIAIHKPRSFISQAKNPRPNQRYAWQLLTWSNQAPLCSYGRSSSKDGSRDGSRDGDGSGGNKLILEPRNLPKLACCGRLDLDSTGLLLFSQDGTVARKLIGEGNSVIKHYEVAVQVRSPPSTTADYRAVGRVRKESEWGRSGRKSLDQRQQQQPSVSGGAEEEEEEEIEEIVDLNEIVSKLRYGLSLDGQQLKPAQVEWMHELEPAAAGERGGGGGGERRWRMRFSLSQGKYRQIRRMCDLVGLDVLELKRVGVGGLSLSDFEEPHLFADPSSSSSFSDDSSSSSRSSSSSNDKGDSALYSSSSSSSSSSSFRPGQWRVLDEELLSRLWK